MLNEVGGRTDLARALEAMAAVEVESGALERAARLLGAAEALREASGASMMPMEQPWHEDVVAKVRAGLDETTLRRAWVQGRVADASKLAVEESQR